LLDYRTKDGSTSLHRAVERDCLEAVSWVLSLKKNPHETLNWIFFVQQNSPWAWSIAELSRCQNVDSRVFIGYEEDGF
jgi:hypothetical protein